MRFHTTLAAALLSASFVCAQSTKAKATTPGNRVVTKTRSTTQARVPVHTSSVRLPASKQKPASRQQASAKQWAPPRQSGPTPDRYREIQESLISKGYMQGTATGIWDQNSMDAMRKFQIDQKMEPTGKISAKALITLGLGPKDETAPPTPTK
jgi:hypothetical protein